MAEDEPIERILALFREVAAYTIPPRMGSGGEPPRWLTARCLMDCSHQRFLECHTHADAHRSPRPCHTSYAGVKSGEWRIEDRIFNGRLTVMDCGSVCELRLNDGNTCVAAAIQLLQALPSTSACHRLSCCLSFYTLYELSSRAATEWRC